MASLPYEMFDLERSASDARRFDRMEHIYHRGQDLAWNGQEVLAAIVKKHGGVHLSPTLREAVRAVYAPIMWGELAAWKISAQLADRLVPLEAKMAATSQAHDEARHFYVMHDYLELALGKAPDRMSGASEKLIRNVLEVDDLACKLMGMQLQIETTALTIFQASRESAFCPVLTELMPYYEKDEARHVGLGTQALPILMREMGRIEGARLSLFALGTTFWLIAANKQMETGLRTLGIEPRRTLQLAKSKQMIVWNELWNANGNEQGRKLGEASVRAIEAIGNGLWPPPGFESPLGRLRAFASALRHGVEEVPTAIDPTESLGTKPHSGSGPLN